MSSFEELELPSREAEVLEDTHQSGLKLSLHRHIIERLEEDGLMLELSREELQPHVYDYVEDYLAHHQLHRNATEKATLVAELLDEMLGYGPLQSLLDDPAIDDILINGAKDVFVERNGRLERSSLRFFNDQHVLRVVRRMVAPLGRRIDEASPMVDARLPDGSRINAIIPPLAIDGPCLSIRKFRRDGLAMEDLIRSGSLSGAMSRLLIDAVQSRLNILVSGSTGAGKTTLLNVLSQSIGLEGRVVTIEDAAELQLRNAHVVRLETRPPNCEGEGEITARELVKNALRMRPDRIILGESRGGEVLDMLQAMNTGHQGSMSTVHANSARDALVRLEMMVTLSGFAATEELIKRIIASSLDLVVHVSRLREGKRLVTDIIEVQDVADGQIRVQQLFTYDADSGGFEGVDQLSTGLQRKLRGDRA